MGHTFINVAYHVVFSTKDRKNIITADVRQRLYEYMVGVARAEFGQAMIVGGTENHVHALLSIRPMIAISAAMGKLKSLSSGWVNKTVNSAYPFRWQNGYAAFSVSHSACPKVHTYIARQVEHHRKMTFEEEFMAFLRRHGIEYDPATIWD